MFAMTVVIGVFVIAFFISPALPKFFAFIYTSVFFRNPGFAFLQSAHI